MIKLGFDEGCGERGVCLLVFSSLFSYHEKGGSRGGIGGIGGMEVLDLRCRWKMLVCYVIIWMTAQ